jgi:hypothetical protein
MKIFKFILLITLVAFTINQVKINGVESPKLFTNPDQPISNVSFESEKVVFGYSGKVYQMPYLTQELGDLCVEFSDMSGYSMNLFYFKNGVISAKTEIKLREPTPDKTGERVHITPYLSNLLDFQLELLNRVPNLIYYVSRVTYIELGVKDNSAPNQLRAMMTGDLVLLYDPKKHKASIGMEDHECQYRNTGGIYNECYTIDQTSGLKQFYGTPINQEISGKAGLYSVNLKFVDHVRVPSIVNYPNIRLSTNDLYLFDKMSQFVKRKNESYYNNEERKKREKEKQEQDRRNFLKVVSDYTDSQENEEMSHVSLNGATETNHYPVFDGLNPIEQQDYKEMKSKNKHEVNWDYFFPQTDSKKVYEDEAEGSRMKKRQKTNIPACARKFRKS